MKSKSYEEDNRPHDDGGLMDKPATALFLKVSVGALDRYCREEGLPFIKMGRAVRFDREDVGDWLDQRTKNKGDDSRPGRGGKRM